MNRDERPYSGTDVPASRSQMQIYEMLDRQGASPVQLTAWDDKLELRFQKPIDCGSGDRKPVTVLIIVPLPERPKELTKEEKRALKLKGDELPLTFTQYEQEKRRLYRSLFYFLKAKFDAIENGFIDFTQEFLPYVEYAPGKTVHQDVLPKLQKGLIQGSVSTVFQITSDAGRANGRP